jgi:hypothetical protein
LQDIARQQRQITTHAQDGHDTKVGADGWRRVARLDRTQGVARHACARSKLYRTQALGLAQALEAVAQLQEQLALKEDMGFTANHLTNNLTKLPILVKLLIIFSTNMPVEPILPLCKHFPLPQQD